MQGLDCALGCRGSWGCSCLGFRDLAWCLGGGGGGLGEGVRV